MILENLLPAENQTAKFDNTAVVESTTVTPGTHIGEFGDLSTTDNVLLVVQEVSKENAEASVTEAEEAPKSNSLRFTKAEKELILKLFYTPTSELSSEALVAKIEEETGKVIPVAFLAQFFQAGFNLGLRSRPRKNVPVVVEKKERTKKVKTLAFAFEGEEEIVIDLTKKEEETPEVETTNN